MVFIKKTLHCCFGIRSLAVVFLAILSLVGCASHRMPGTSPDLLGYSESGKASYYSMKYQFRKTASGERFNNYSMTAAHRYLPFGTKLMVTNITNGRTVKVRINDRGPFIKGRIIDLTQAAFSEIENLDKGITEVQIKVVN